jgi:hypothetical protein
LIENSRSFRVLSSDSDIILVGVKAQQLYFNQSMVKIKYERRAGRVGERGKEEMQGDAENQGLSACVMCDRDPKTQECRYHARKHNKTMTWRFQTVRWLGAEEN